MERSAAASCLANCLDGLSVIDPTLTGWRRKGGSRKGAAANAVLPIDAHALTGHLKMQHRDIGRDPMPELGFTFAAWNGGAGGQDTAFSCTVGLQANNPNLRNSAVVSLPPSWTAASERVRAVVQVLREVWDPEEVVYFGEDRSRQTLWPSPSA